MDILVLKTLPSPLINVQQSIVRCLEELKCKEISQISVIVRFNENNSEYYKPKYAPSIELLLKSLYEIPSLLTNTEGSIYKINMMVLFDAWISYRDFIGGEGNKEAAHYDYILYDGADVEWVNRINNYFSKMGDVNIREIKARERELVPTNDSKHEVNPTIKEMGYEIGVVGGTFDHLHYAHKILLTLASWLVNHRLIVGVTAPEMLSSKKHKELIEPLEKRMRNVEGFIRLLKPTLEVQTMPIYDMYGPTITEGKIDLLVASEEVKQSCLEVLQKRVENGLSPIALYTIPVLNLGSIAAFQDKKLSSTTIRAFLANQCNY